MRTMEIEVRSIESALIAAEEQLRVNRKYLKTEIIKEKRTFLGKKKLIVKVIVETDFKNLIYNYLVSILDSMEIKYSVDIKELDNSTGFYIETENNPLLIGKEGRTLKALQSLCKKIANIYFEEKINFTVDVGGYKEMRMLHLEMLATKTAKEVMRSKIPTKLDPMNSYERRVIHAKLSEWRDVLTESIGIDPNRCLIIKPKAK